MNSLKTASAPATVSRPAAPTPVPRRTLTDECLEQFLSAHARWLEIPELGQQLDLTSVNLRGSNLLRGKNLSRAKLTDTCLWDADLTGTNLTDAEDLLTENLSGANLRRAKLPANVLFEGALKNIEELSKNAGKLFLSLILVTAFVLISVVKVKDAQLILESGTANLPLVNVEIPMRLFLLAGPVVLMVLFVSTQLYLQRLWESMADLPAVFTDGASLERKTYPWLLNDRVRCFFPHLRIRRRPLAIIQESLFVFLSYALTPIAVVMVWIRCSVRHDWIITGGHIAVILCVLWLSVLFNCLGRVTLRRDHTFFRRFGTSRQFWFWWTTVGSLLFFTTGCVLYSVSSLLIKSRSRFVPVLQLTDAELSIKPEKWVMPLLSRQHNIAQEQSFLNSLRAVRPALLPMSDMRNCVAERAFLVNADLRGANLSGANLKRANLSGAIFSQISHNDIFESAQLSRSRTIEIKEPIGFSVVAFSPKLLLYRLLNAMNKRDVARSSLINADLAYADLTFANLFGADLTNAKLTGTHLVSADLTEAILAHTDLTGTDLTGAYLIGADLTHADLIFTRLNGADLSGADLSTANLASVDLENAIVNDATKLPDNLKILGYRKVWDPKSPSKQYRIVRIKEASSSER